MATRTVKPRYKMVGGGFNGSKGADVSADSKDDAGRKAKPKLRPKGETGPAATTAATKAVDPLRGVGKLIPLSEITRSPFQCREDFDPEEISSLAASIKAHGLLQPIVVRQLTPICHELIAGERRWRAAGEAGLEKIPAVIREADDRLAATLCALENLQRKDLNAIEQANSLQAIVDQGVKQKDLAALVGVSQAEISNRLRLLKLPEAWQHRIISGEISARHGRALAAHVKNAKLLDEAADLLVSRPHMSAEDWEAAVDMLAHGALRRTYEPKVSASEPMGSDEEPVGLRDESPVNPGEQLARHERQVDRDQRDEEARDAVWQRRLDRLEKTIHGLAEEFGDDLYHDQLVDLLERATTQLRPAKRRRK